MEQCLDSLLDRLMDRVAASPEREREWLDLLSQLEYIGCRKIMKALSYEEISLDVLQHVAEEAQHAFLLKSLVAAADPDHCSWATSPLSDIGWKYFQSVDQEVARLPQVAGLNYPAVSWAVEQRVLTLYPKYLEKTKNEEVKRVLQRIVAQERRHGGRFEMVQYPEGLRSRLEALEAKLWGEFLEALERHIDPAVAEAYPSGPCYARPEADVRATD